MDWLLRNMSMTLQPNLPSPPPPPPQSMDWFFWLSRTGLEPVLVYKYGLVLGENELQSDDISYFDHEFLWSMGIAVAKHRLEIIKLARKEKGGRGGGAAVETRPLSGLFSVISRTKKSFRKYIAKLVYHDEEGIKASSKDLPGKHEEEIMVFEKRSSNLAFSGPLVDRRVQERILPTKPRNPKWSGPLYPPKSPLPGNRYPVGSPRWSGLARNPNVSGSQDRMIPIPKVAYGSNSVDYDVHEQSLWIELFHDMKPT